VPEPATQETDEVAELRERVAQLERVLAERTDRALALERELAERTERAHAAVVAAEERVYWLDRWHLDLNALMERPAAQRSYEVARQARRAVRLAGKVRRRLSR
jgi:hypothetical protein